MRRVHDGPLAQARALEAARDQVPLRDGDLFLLDVAREADHLHAVEQRRRDAVGRVGRGDEEDLRHVEGQVEVVVAKGHVLLGVEHLQEGRRRGRPGRRPRACRSRRS